MKTNLFYLTLSKGLLSAALSVLSVVANAAALQVEVKDADKRLLEGAIVYLKSDVLPPAVPMQSVSISQKGKQFVPQRLVVTTGTAIEFPNRDTFRHHVYSFSEPKPFELKLYVGKPKAPVMFSKPGVVVLGCNIHDHMIGWVVVLDTPLFAESDEHGLAVFHDLKPGEYALHVWHQDLFFGRSTFQMKLQIANKTQKITLVMNN